jgi:hypothetical protein
MDLPPNVARLAAYQREQEAQASRLAATEKGGDAKSVWVEMRSASSIRSERVRWAWLGRMPLRSLVVVAGEKGLGKSILTNTRLATEASRGRLDGELHGRPIHVAVCTAEDDWRSVVKPRLMAHGADLHRVHELYVTGPDGETTLTLPDHVPLLEARVVAMRATGHPIGMVVIDPIGAFLSRATDTHRDASVRRALAPLATMADRLDLVVVIVAHLTKDESARLINRVSGSGAFVNAARSVLVFARHPDDPDGERGLDRVLVHVGSNWGRHAKTLAARVEGHWTDLEDGSRTEVGYVQLLGECDIGVEDLQRGAEDSTGADVEEAIAAALANCPRPSREVKAEVSAELGCARKTVERAGVRLAAAGDIEVESEGFPRTTTWRLASGDAPVGTPPDTRRVPTGENPVVTGDSALSEPDGVPTGVPTVKTPVVTGDSAPLGPSRDTRAGVSLLEADMSLLGAELADGSHLAGDAISDTLSDSSDDRNDPWTSSAENDPWASAPPPARPPERPVADLTGGEIPACREAATPPNTDDATLKLDSTSPLDAVRSGKPCRKHPDAGRWRHAASDFWLCLDCYPVTAGLRGVVIECSDLEGD